MLPVAVPSETRGVFWNWRSVAVRFPGGFTAEGAQLAKQAIVIAEETDANFLGDAGDALSSILRDLVTRNSGPMPTLSSTQLNTSN